MITVYAGLWYLSKDIGEETRIVLFAVIITFNALFGIIWITSYLSNASWAQLVVKRCRIEHEYLEPEPIIPYFPEIEIKQVPFDKIRFLSNTI